MKSIVNQIACDFAFYSSFLEGQASKPSKKGREVSTPCPRAANDAAIHPCIRDGWPHRKTRNNVWTPQQLAAPKQRCGARGLAPKEAPMLPHCMDGVSKAIQPTYGRPTPHGYKILN